MTSKALPFALSLLLVAAALPAATTWGYDPEHEETIDLIDLVEGAADLVAREGVEDACRKFRIPGSTWLHGETYVFVIDMQGTTICHPAQPSLEGRVILEIRDPKGRPVVRNFLRELEGGSEDGWVHYQWPTPQQKYVFFWKTSYVRRAADPVTGQEYIVGSGVYQMPMERFFVVEQVEDAAELIGRRGREAFAELRDATSGYRFYDAYLFVLDGEGTTLVNVAFPDQEGANVVGLRDREGKEFIRAMLTELEERDAAWVDYLWPRPGDKVASPKSSYVRKVEHRGETLIVGAGVYLD